MRERGRKRREDASSQCSHHHNDNKHVAEKVFGALEGMVKKNGGAGQP